MTDGTTFGRWLSAERRAAGLSQRQFAERLGLREAILVNELEHDRVDPNPYVSAISLALSVDEQQVRVLAEGHEHDALLRENERQSTEARMLAFRLERAAR